MKIAIVGATGLVGLEMKNILPEYLPKAEVFLFASHARPEDNVLDLSQSIDILKTCDYILNAANSEVALELKEHLGPEQILIDNSSAFRLEPGVPLIVPEVNGEFLKSRPQIVANPNCTAILLCVALNALKEPGFTRVVVSTYQAASGAGIKGLEELDAQIKAVGLGKEIPKPEVFPAQLFANVLSHNSPIRPENIMGAGYNDEEWKVVEETRKIIDIRHLAISATCIRVPVRRAHTEAVMVDMKSEITLEELRKAFASAPGVKVVDDWNANHFPMPLEAQNQDLVYVGRIRKDAFLPRTVHFMISGDQLRKGAATNAIQICKYLTQLE